MRPPGGTACVLIALGAAATPATAAPRAAAAWARTATRATSIKGAALTSDAPARGILRLAVTLKPRHAAAERAALRAMYTPGSATYHSFLTPAQWRASYAPTRGQVRALLSYLRGQGFTGLSVQGDRLLVTARGSVAQAEKAFHTTIGEFTLPGRTGASFRANITAAEVPASLGGTVQAVVGLSSWRLPVPHPLLITKKRAATPAAGSPVVPNEVPPADFQATYDAGGTATGAKTSVALLTEGSVTGTITDLRLAESAFKLPQVPVTIVPVGPQSTDTSGADEWDLDTQTSSAMATTLQHIYLYNVGALDDTDLDTAFAAFVSQDKAVAMSASVGGCDVGPYLDGSMVSTDNVLAEGAMQGQTLFASSGDNGDGCAFVAATGVPSSFPGTNWPASGMYATAVGGTSLVSDASGNRVAEIGWIGSGGGDQRDREPGFLDLRQRPVLRPAVRRGRPRRP